MYLMYFCRFTCYSYSFFLGLYDNTNWIVLLANVCLKWKIAVIKCFLSQLHSDIDSVWNPDQPSSTQLQKGLRTNSMTETGLARVAKAKKFGRDFFGERCCYVGRIAGRGDPLHVKPAEPHRDLGTSAPRMLCGPRWGSRRHRAVLSSARTTQACWMRRYERIFQKLHLN